MKKLEETKEQGITLVALVVTIIIMLILSAITINIFLGDKGIFERTIKSKNEYEKAVKNEQKELIKLINEMEDLVDEEKKFIISYNIDIGENYKEVAKQSQNCLEPSSFTPKKEGWEFIGWREDSESSEEILTEKILEDNIELYAVFRQTITLSYNANGGSRTPETQTGYRYYNNGNVANPSFILATAIARSGYTFQNWRLNSASGTAYNAKGSITLSSSATMYAKWIANTVYLYNSGNENTSLTGGWSAYLESGSGSATYTTTKNSSNLYISTVCNAYQAKRTAGFKTAKVVDLTGYNKLHVKLRFVTNNNAAYYIKSLNTNKVYYMHGNTSAQDITTTNTFNISGNTGLQIAITLYSSFTQETTGSLYIYQVWATV